MTEAVNEVELDNKTKKLFKDIRVDDVIIDQLIQKYGSERANVLAVQINSNPALLAQFLDLDFYSSRELAEVIERLDFPSEKIDEAVNLTKEEAKKNNATKKEEKTEDLPEEDIVVDYSKMSNFSANSTRYRARMRTEEAVNGMLVSKRVGKKNTELPSSKFNNIVREARKSKFNEDFPKLNRADFASDAEYKTALQEQYVAMKNQQWKYASVESALSFHKMARGLPEKNRQGLSQVTSSSIAKKAAQSIEKQFDVFSDVEVTEENKDWFISQTVENYSEDAMYNDDIKYGNVGYAPSSTPDCALGNAKRTAEACENMGTYGSKNVMENVSGVAGATNIHIYTQAKYNNNPRYGNAKESGGWAPRSDITLEEAILTGKMGSGDMFSEFVGTNTGSSHHALTLVDVVKNDKGEVVSYTISDNNGGGDNEGTRIYTFKMGEKNPDNRWANKKIIYTAVHKIKEDEFIKEAQGASIEELEKMVNTTRDEVVRPFGLIDQLATEEHVCFFSEKWMKTCGSQQKAIRLGVLRNLYMMQYVAQNKELVSDYLYKDIEKKEYKESLKYDIDLNKLLNEPHGSEYLRADLSKVSPASVIKNLEERLSEADRYALQRKTLEDIIYTKKDENLFQKAMSSVFGRKTVEGLSPELVEFGKAKIEELKYLEEQARLKESLREMAIVNDKDISLEEVDMRTYKSVQEERRRLEEYKRKNKATMSEDEEKTIDEYIKSLKKEEKFRKKIEEKGLDDDLRVSLKDVGAKAQAVDVEKTAKETTPDVSFERASAGNETKPSVTIGKSR